MISRLDIRHSLPGGSGILLRLSHTTAQDIGAALIRPDGYLAWAAAPGEPDAAGLDAAIARWFGSRPVREVRAGSGHPGR
jgi:aromatic ring hydroxylase-like protein